MTAGRWPLAACRDGSGCAGGLADRGKPDADGCDGSGDLAANPHGCLHDHSRDALRADHQFGKVESGDTLDAAVPEDEQTAVDEHDLQAEDRLAGGAVLGAEQPAGVRGDVAADRGDRSARGIRGKSESMFGEGGIEIRVDPQGSLHIGDRACGHQHQRHAF